MKMCLITSQKQRTEEGDATKTKEMLPRLYSLEFSSSFYNPDHPHPGQNGSRTDAFSQWKLFKNISNG